MSERERSDGNESAEPGGWVDAFTIKRIRDGLTDRSVPAAPGRIHPRDQLQLVIAGLLLDIRALLHAHHDD